MGLTLPTWLGLALVIGSAAVLTALALYLADRPDPEDPEP